MVEATVDADLRQGKANAAHAGRKAVFPNMAGTWEFVTHSEGVDIQGILVIQQRGKKLTGTLTNEGQPPGSFKAKFILDKGRIGSIKGKIVNRVVDSNGKPIESPVHDDRDDLDRDGDGNFNNDPDSMHGTIGNSPEGAAFDATHTVFDD